MAQVKIYGVRSELVGKRQALSDAIHAAVMEVLGLPAGKRAHRFFPLDAEDFLMPEGRGADYLILEVFLMAGRTRETRKQLVRRLFELLFERVGLAPLNLEICLVESPPENWGFRGLHGDEAVLPYAVVR